MLRCMSCPVAVQCFNACDVTRCAGLDGLQLKSAYNPYTEPSMVCASPVLVVRWVHGRQCRSPCFGCVVSLAAAGGVCQASDAGSQGDWQQWCVRTTLLHMARCRG